jgi:hypothetical protein
MKNYQKIVYGTLISLSSLGIFNEVYSQRSMNSSHPSSPTHPGNILNPNNPTSPLYQQHMERRSESQKNKPATKGLDSLISTTKGEKLDSAVTIKNEYSPKEEVMMEIMAMGVAGGLTGIIFLGMKLASRNSKFQDLPEE